MILHGRFVSAGRITNYEMRDLRIKKNFSKYRRQRLKKDVWMWLYTWATVSQDFHPQSIEEWKEHGG